MRSLLCAVRFSADTVASKRGKRCPARARSASSPPKSSVPSSTNERAPTPPLTGRWCAPGSSSWPPRKSPTRRSPRGWTPHPRRSASGASAFTRKVCPDWKIGPARAGPRPFPPSVRVEVKAIACELPASSGVPLSRWSAEEVAREVVERGIVAEISGATIWRWLCEDAIRPFYHRSWIFPRDPDFAQKASRVLDLYEGWWEGEPLGEKEYVISADEKTSIQARHRPNPTLPAGEGRKTRVEHEYERKGALAYLAAWDVHRAKLFGRCEAKNGIEPFGRLVEQVMSVEPYASADRVFWVVDNGSSHRGETSVKRLEGAFSNLRLIHLPVHASWLNQIEIYFSVVARKVMNPNDFADLEELAEYLLAFGERYEQVAEPFAWKFTRRDLGRLLDRLAERQPLLSSSTAA